MFPLLRREPKEGTEGLEEGSPTHLPRAVRGEGSSAKFLSSHLARRLMKQSDSKSPSREKRERNPSWPRHQWVKGIGIVWQDTLWA